MLRLQKNSKFKFLVLSSIIALGLHNNDSKAAGFGVDLYSASSLGNAHAGVVTGSHDVSNIFINPANLNDVKDKSVYLSLTYLDVNIDDDLTSANTADTNSVTGSRNNDGGIDNSILPAFYYANRIDKNTVFGFNINSPFAIATKYDENWVGRYRAIDSDVLTVNFNPSISRKISNKLSIATGIQVQYIESRFTRDITTDGSSNSKHRAKIKGDDWGLGYNLGAKYSFSPDLEFGIGYRSKINHTLDGYGRVITANINDRVHANLTTPESLILGFKYNINDKTQLISDVAINRWSRVKYVDIKSANNSLAAEDINFNMQNSTKIALGVNYQISNPLKLRAGIAYEESAFRNTETRTSRIPTGDLIWGTVGAEYKINNDAKIDFAYLHQDYNKTSSDLSGPSNGSGSSLSSYYKTTVNAYSVGFGINF